MKRFAALLLALLLMLGMTTTALAAKPKPTGVADPEDVYTGNASEWSFVLWLDDRQGEFQELGSWPRDEGLSGTYKLEVDLNFDIYEGSTLYISLVGGTTSGWYDMFTWDNMVKPLREDYYTDDPEWWDTTKYVEIKDAADAYKEVLNKYKSTFTLSVFERIKPRHTPSKFIESVGWEWFDGAPSYISPEAYINGQGDPRYIVLAVHFVDNFVMTKEVQQELEFWFNIGGKSYKDDGFAIDANFTFVEERLDKGQRDAGSFHENLGGVVLEPLANFSGFELQIGEGGEDVFVTTNLFEGHKIYATSKLKWADEFEPLFLNAERLLAIYTLRAANLYPNACRVRLDFPNPVAYVYDAEGKYIGTTKEELPWSSIYFISEVKQDSIVPAVTSPEAEKVQMTMAEYLYWLATGEIPDSAKIITEASSEDTGTLLS